MKNIANIGNIPKEYMYDSEFDTKLKTILIKKGDVISAPAGKDSEHQFINNSEEILQILDIGTREKDDIITYPDENIMYIKDKNLVFNINDSIKNWTSEPNE